MAEAGNVTVHVDIPELVLICKVENSMVNDYRDFQYDVQISVGGVVVLDRTYTDENDRYGEANFAYDADEARDKALTEFGERLKAVLQL